MKHVVHCKKESYDVYIGRPSKWGNNYSHNYNTSASYKVDSREDAIRAYEYDLWSNSTLVAEAQSELKNKVLGCWCAPLACHGEVLYKYANSTTLYRPVSDEEWKLIADNNCMKFPPRLPEQPIFYPVCTYQYALEIATKWNKGGHVTKFYVNDALLSKYQSHVVGSSLHTEYWIPAEELEDFNENIIGPEGLRIMNVWSYENT